MNKSKLLVFLVGVMITTTVAYFVYKTNVNKRIMILPFKEESFESVEDPNARAEYESRMLIDPATGRIPDNIREKELEFAKTLPKVESLSLSKSSGVNNLTWSARGPINRGGRTRALGVDIRTQTPGSVTIIAGGASGGIWKSTDDGATWANKLSPNSIHSTTSIAQDTRSGHEDTWYVGTGERASNLLGGYSTLYLGDGIYKSTDNGETWALLPSTSNGSPQQYSSAFDFVFDIAVNKATGSVFAAASNTIQRSTDGGSTWSTVRGSLQNNAYTDVQITSTGVIYATIQSGVTNPGIWRSSDDGATWTSITPSTWPSSYGRTVLGIAPSNENVVYFWAYTGSGTTKTQFWKYSYPGSGDGSGDANWTNLTANLPAPTGNVAGINVQGAYDMIIRVKPDDSLFVVIGGTNLYRSTDGFTTAVSATGSTGWMGGYAIANDVTQYANHHPDQHSLVFLTGANTKVLYSGHDGGLSRTNDVTASSVVWNSLNLGYVTSQFYSLAIDPVTANDNHIIGGLQDNGNYFTSSSNYSNNWTQLELGGDGGITAITGGHTYYYFETQNGNVWGFQLNSNTGQYTNYVNVQPVYNTNYLFVTPFMLDPNNSSIMYLAAGDSVWRNSNLLGITWGSQSRTYTNWDSLTHTSTGATISALGISKAPANRLYVGGSNGTLLRIDSANTGDPTSTNLTSALTSAGASSGAYINCIAVDPSNADKVFVVYSNYSVRSLFVTTDGGTTWQDVSGNLEQNSNGSGNGPSCRWVGYLDDGANGTFYVATSTGLYSTSNLNGSSTVWAQEGSSTIGSVVCPMVVTRQADGLVALCTHGSGIYSANQSFVAVDNVKSTTPTQFALNQNYPNPFNPSTNISFALPSPNNVKITVYDITGKKIADVLNQALSAGLHTVNFNAANLASGTYIYRIQAGDFVEAKKMVLLK